MKIIFKYIIGLFIISIIGLISYQLTAYYKKNTYTGSNISSNKNKITLSVWTTESDPKSIAVMEDIGKQLNAEFEYIDKVEVSSIKWSDLSAKLQNAFEAGQMPGVTHLEPFYTSSFVQKGLLLPVDDLVNKLGEQDIHEGVRKIAFFNGHYYGIPQHYGVTPLGARLDLVKKIPQTWDEMLATAKALTKPAEHKYGIFFPGNDRFFVDTIFFSTLASNGGSAYTEDGKPNLDNKQVIETLAYLKELIKYAPPDWTTSNFLDAFPRMVSGEIAMTTFTAGRAIKIFDETWPATQATSAPNTFVQFLSPHGPSGTTGMAPIDCEPFVVVNQKMNKGTSLEKGAIIEAASKRYVELLYQKDNYLALLNTVPLHLMPIFKSLEPEYANFDFVKRWPVWHQASVDMMINKQVSPYFATHEKELAIPYLYDLYSQKVITDMVISVLLGQAEPAAAAKTAQEKAIAIAKQYEPAPTNVH